MLGLFIDEYLVEIRVSSNGVLTVPNHQSRQVGLQKTQAQRMNRRCKTENIPHIVVPDQKDSANPNGIEVLPGKRPPAVNDRLNNFSKKRLKTSILLFLYQKFSPHINYSLVLSHSEAMNRLQKNNTHQMAAIN